MWTQRGQTLAGSRGSIIGHQAVVIFLFLSLRLSTATAIVGHDTCEADAQCLNGGFCVAVGTTAGSFNHCYCKDGYGGSRCEQYCPLLCRNGGVCHPNDERGSDLLMREEASSYRDEDFVCKCLGYYTGKLCDLPYENCSDGRRCLNGGQCVDGSAGSSSCLCQLNFFGDSCDIHAPVGTSKPQSTPSSSDKGITISQHSTASSQPIITDTKNDSLNADGEKMNQSFSSQKYPSPTPFIQNQQEHAELLQKSPPGGIAKVTQPVPETPDFLSENKLLFIVSIGVIAFLLTVATGLLVQRRWHYSRVKSSTFCTNESHQPYLSHFSSTDGSWKFVV